MNETIKRSITASVIGTIFWLIFFYCHPIFFSLLLLGILIIILFTEWNKICKTKGLWFWFITLWYPILPFMLIMYMNSTPKYHNLVYYLFLIVFAFDSTAYITGKLLGYHKIIPRISPGKTVEGCIGGFLGALITFYWAILDVTPPIPYWFSITFVLFTCLHAFVGDIFESFLKRKANIKDSGHTLPGHGGFLDRFDAIIMTTYFFFLFKDELIKFLG